MEGILLFSPALTAMITAVVLMIIFRKKADPEKYSVIFALVALALGIIHLWSEFYPFEYTGEKGLDYIGQAMAWAMIVSSIRISTLAAYLSFAIAATVYAIKAAKDKKKRKKGIISIVIAWICSVIIGSLMAVSAVTDMDQKKSLSVKVTDVTLTKDYEGNDSAVITIEFYNGSKSSVTYLSSVYEEVTQDDGEIYHTPVPELPDDPDDDIRSVGPGESVTIRRSYKLDDEDGPVRILCRSYDGKVVYVDSEYIPE